MSGARPMMRCGRCGQRIPTTRLDFAAMKLPHPSGLSGTDVLYAMDPHHRDGAPCVAPIDTDVDLADDMRVTSAALAYWRGQGIERLVALWTAEEQRLDALNPRFS